jgi:hypothetical protein
MINHEKLSINYNLREKRLRNPNKATDFKIWQSLMRQNQLTKYTYPFSSEPGLWAPSVDGDGEGAASPKG